MSATPRLSVVLPAYRDAPAVATAVPRLRVELADVGSIEIVVVDDGSGDETGDTAWDAGADQVIRLARNLGKGGAVRAGVLAARGRAVVFTDVDLSYSPAQIRRVLDELEHGAAMVVGSRRHVDASALVRARRLRELSGRLFNAVSRAVVMGETRDTQCGLKGFSHDWARRLFSATCVNGFAFDVELFVAAREAGVDVVEVPVELASSASSTVRLGRDAARMVVDLARIRRRTRAGAYRTEALTTPG